MFEEVSDLGFAEAVSEVFEPGIFRVARTPDSFGPNDGFPPAPAYVTNVTAGYLDIGPNQEPYIHRQFLLMNQEFLPAKEDFIARYTATVCKFQDETLPKLNSYIPNISTPSELRDWYIDETAKEDRRLVAAHFLGRVIANGEIIEGVAYPQLIADKLRLMIRECIITHKPLLDEIRGLATEEEMEIINREFGLVLRNDTELQNIGPITASIALPTNSEMRKFMDTFYPKTKPAPTKRTGLLSKKTPKRKR